MKKIKIPVFLKIIFLIIIIIFTTLIYARFIATQNIQINEYKIISKNLPDEYHGIRIAHITDIHYGRTTNKKQLEELVKKINKTKPDVVVLTGDLIDKDTKLDEKIIKEISSILMGIDAKIKKYAIMGNHDYKFKDWKKIIKKANFTNLNDGFDLIYKESNVPILIAGSSTNNRGKSTINQKLLSTFEYLNNNQTVYNILLVHEPDYIDYINKNEFNLILAGHSHHGQIRLPLIGAIILPDGAKKYYNGYYEFNKTKLYISNGIGTSTINFRLFNKPSFNLYRITNK